MTFFSSLATSPSCIWDLPTSDYLLHFCPWVARCSSRPIALLYPKHWNLVCSSHRAFILFIALLCDITQFLARMSYPLKALPKDPKTQFPSHLPHDFSLSPYSPLFCLPPNHYYKLCYLLFVFAPTKAPWRQGLLGDLGVAQMPRTLSK